MKFTPTRANVIDSLRTSYLLWLFALTSSLSCCAADVVFIRASMAPSTEERDVELASEFYGLNLRTLTVSMKHDDPSVKHALENNATLAVVIAAGALSSLNRKEVLMATRRKSMSSIPLLILGVTKDTDTAVLKTWSDGTIVGVKPIDRAVSRQAYHFARRENLTQQLSNAEIPFRSARAFSLQLNEPGSAEEITVVRDRSEDLPVFVRFGRDNLFVAGEVLPPSTSVLAGNWPETFSAFPSVAPLFMFVKYAGADRAWHAIRHYANLTIDDAWLHEPYGHLDYQALLEEMKKHHFHSTIAFIPWNYDRSEPGVVSLIRSHTNDFSISIHGDNHDHKEFTDYRTKPLQFQITALKQSLSRMDRFKSLTGIPYDKVMVFPHSIAPEQTLAALKTYNYLATVNSSNVPMDSVEPSGFSLALRPLTLSFANFPSIRRYSVEVPIPNSMLAMDAFLDNPLFFYCHQAFFANGINAFDPVADEVNGLDPHTRWSGLGEMIRHLYLIKRRGDSDYDVLAFATSVALENVSGRDSTFYVKKQESGIPFITSVTVDGRPYSYRLHDGYLDISILVPAGMTRSVSIEYANDLLAAPISISKDSLLVNLLRAASDLRDIWLSRLVVGRSLIRFYYEHDITPTEVVVCVFILLAASIWSGYRVRHIKFRQPRTARQL